MATKRKKTNKAMGTLMLRAIHEALIKVLCKAPKLVTSDNAHPQITAFAVKPED